MSEPGSRCTVQVTVNGEVCREDVETRVHLADFLRHRVGLPGTHLGCEQGVCGMCTVLLDGVPVKSCIVLAAQADGHEVTTVESLGRGDQLDDLQAAFKDHHALQCGFCTPAFLLVSRSLAEEKPLSRPELREALSGVLCRCTGYSRIVDAVEDWLSAAGAAERNGHSA
jgi:aerobic-type carbon monoxide dehydrogenase small subunit (CoxS/CutS family)